MTDSFWQHRSWSLEWKQAINPTPFAVTLPGSYHLRKLLVHYTFIGGYSNHPGGGNYPLNVGVKYTVEWFPASGDQRRIFSARYSVPGQFVVYQPSGGATPGWYTKHRGGDHEIGFNQKYNYPQYDPAQNGVVQLNWGVEFDGIQSDPHEGWFEGTFSVLGQRPDGG